MFPRIREIGTPKGPWKLILFCLQEVIWCSKGRRFRTKIYMCAPNFAGQQNNVGSFVPTPEPIFSKSVNKAKLSFTRSPLFRSENHIPPPLPLRKRIFSSSRDLMIFTPHAHHYWPYFCSFCTYFTVNVVSLIFSLFFNFPSFSLPPFSYFPPNEKVD